MNRMRAERESASRNADKAMTKGGLSYTAQENTAFAGQWAVVTWQNGQPVQREY